MIFKLKSILINVFCPLFLGGIIYILFRTTSTRIFDWIKMIGINPFILNFRKFSLPIKEYLPSWFYYSFPDALWMYSFSYSIMVIWNSRQIFWIFFPLTIGLSYEVAQLLKIIPGTFDILDLFFTILAFCTSLFSINLKLNSND